MYVEKLWAENKRPWVICMNVVWYERLECLWMTGAMFCLSIVTYLHLATISGTKDKTDQTKLCINLYSTTQ